MNWQLLAVSCIVLFAACYLVRQTWRSWSGRKGCGGGCGCGGKSAVSQEGNGQNTLIPVEQIKLRRRGIDSQ